MMCCYYPTTTVAIDDDIDFLGVLTEHLGITNCIPYPHPERAIEILKNQNPFERLLNRIIKPSRISKYSDVAPDDHAVLFNMRGLHEEIYNKNRFSDVSVLIVDYYMDNISGIEVCESLKNHPSKKILLTGGTDKEKIAIEAFNNGIIHRFINKNDKNFPNRLKQTISILKKAYFIDLSSLLLPHLMTMPRNLYQYPQFVNLMRNIQDQFEAIEYYMVDTIGTSVFLNSQGDVIWLIVKHESDMDAYEKLARDQEAPHHVVHGISDRALIPFFFSEEDYQQPASNWNEYLYRTHKLPGIPDYYYAICESKQQLHLSNMNIHSFQSYNSLFSVTQI